MEKYSDYAECIESMMKTIKFLSDKNDLPVPVIIADFHYIMTCKKNENNDLSKDANMMANLDIASWLNFCGFITEQEFTEIENRIMTRFGFVKGDE